MRQFAFFIAFFSAAATASAAKSATLDLSTNHNKTLYSLGLSIARDIAGFHLKPAEIPYVLAGLRDAAAGKHPKADLQAHRESLALLLKARRDAPVRAFLAKAAKEPGVRRTRTGLLYKEIKKGAGATPQPTDTVKVHYHGTRIDGSVFDSTRHRGAPSQFPLTGVIRCWREGIPMMKVGGKARLICPAKLAYGDLGEPPAIAPGAALIFDVELLGIVGK